MTALEKLAAANAEGKYICVGLDTELSMIPAYLQSRKNPVLEFNRLIIESTKSSAAAYKLNLAFYEQKGSEGLRILEETLSFIPRDVLTIADGKRGDIGNTSRLYAKSVYENFNFDSATLNPLMGKDSLDPFLDYHDKLSFILALTSNPGSADFQKEELKEGSKLFQLIIKRVLDWNIHSNCGIVFGATNLRELEENLSLINDLPLLLPGVGAQGGNLKELARLLFSFPKNSYLVNVSRGIIYKSRKEDFAGKAAEELILLNRIIQENKNY